MPEFLYDRSPKLRPPEWKVIIGTLAGLVVFVGVGEATPELVSVMLVTFAVAAAVWLFVARRKRLAQADDRAQHQIEEMREEFNAIDVDVYLQRFWGLPPREIVRPLRWLLVQERTSREKALREKTIEELAVEGFSRGEAEQIINMRADAERKAREDAETRIREERQRAIYEAAMAPIRQHESHQPSEGHLTRGFVYVLQQIIDGTEVAKIGIANDISRMAEHQKRGWNVVHVETAGTRERVREIETRVLRLIRERQVDEVPTWATMNMSQGGRSEVTTLPASQLISWIKDLKRQLDS